MKPLIKIVCVLLVAVFLAGTATGIYYLLQRQDVEEVVHRVSVPAQETAETPERFVPEEMAVFAKPEGVNLADDAKLTESGHADVYVGAKAADGRNTTYWEGDGFPASLTLALASEATVSKIAFCLPPLRVWSARTQTVLIETSDDGEHYTALPEQTLAFDPMTGNAVLIQIDPVTTRYLRFTFLANSGANGGQVSEILVFS